MPFLAFVLDSIKRNIVAIARSFIHKPVLSLSYFILVLARNS